MQSALNLLHFSPTSSPPSKIIPPLLQQLPPHYHPKPHILKLHLHQNPSTPPKYQLITIPTLILFKHRQPLHKLVP
ncbi:thioredoxin domain-containing protein, partial [Staphylococcus epidermidis]|uniref:thioredoxin domain-containing protein n=1 Tax=Staphylococcus epidermidis TaxID=1282 RepID=UPI0037D9F7DE